jgi:cell fate regulator YaaT (PSP1 superfamily)
MRQAMTETESHSSVAGLRFQSKGKIYYYDASQFSDLQVGDYVIIATSRGREMAQVVQLFDKSPSPRPSGGWKPIERKATPRDLVTRLMWQQKELKATIDCRAKATELGFDAIKIIGVEFSFDGSRIIFFYSSEGSERLNLKNLHQAMRRQYRKSKVEFHYVGPRDVGKIIGGMGACGLAERCCSRFLTDFSPISIKMAKAQGISLNPQEITGICGRLRCCLLYEYEQYVEARKGMPKRNKKVLTPMGVGKVTDVLALKGKVIVLLEDNNRVEFMKDEIQAYDEMNSNKKKNRQQNKGPMNSEQHTGEKG